MPHPFSARYPGPSVLLVVALLACPADAQVINVFNNTNPGWTNSGAWTPSGPPGSADTAQFATLGTTAGILNQPLLNSGATLSQLAFSHSAFGSDWVLSGTGSIIAGSSTVSGVLSRGIGNYAIDLGDGSATSLTLTGATGTALTGALNVGHGSAVTLSGNTVAALTTTSNISLRGGSLVLDNSAGNPASQRLSGGGSINLHGGGVLEFRSDAAGTNFSGLTGAVTLGTGAATIRLNQTSASPLNVTFGSLVRDQTGASINFQSIGSGTLGGGGAGDPSIKFTTAPGLTNGVIATGIGSNILGFALYNGSDFAGYSIANGVIGVTSTAVSGSLTSSSSQNSRLVGNATIAASGTVTYNTLKISPSAAGQSLAIGSGGILNTVALLLDGATDYTITGGTLVGSASAGPRYIHVTDPNTSLFLSSNLSTNLPITKAGDGFMVLTGTSNQVAFTSSRNVTLTGGTLRVTTTNFNMLAANSPNVQFRGGVIEYDVSAASVSLNRSIANGTGAFNWTGSPVNNIGSGGFSAFSTNPANTLTLNLSSGATLTWGGSGNATDAAFVQDGHALIFGSSQANATVVWTNPVNLDAGTPGPYLIREVKVIQGVGNAADKSRMTGVVNGTNTSDFLKTGAGVLELAAPNTYAGNTQVHQGILLITGSVVPNTGSSNVYVHPSGTLGGTGTLGSAGNNVHVLAAGGISPGVTTGTLTIQGNLTFTSTGTYTVELGGTGSNQFDQTVVNGAVALEDATLATVLTNGYIPANSDRLFLVVNDGVDGVSGTFQGIGQNGTIALGGYTAQVSYAGDFGANTVNGGNDIVLYNFTSVPELGSIALVGLTLLSLGAARMLRRRPSPDPEAEKPGEAPVSP